MIIDSVGEGDIPRLVEVWEASVRSTHDFLSDADIAVYRPLVRDGLYGSLRMACIRDVEGQIIGFIGVSTEKIEALFVDPCWHGVGIGRALTEHALSELGATKVDVNEQNLRAMGFYEKMGFRVLGRSPTDPLGKPYPLLHLGLLEPVT